MNINDEVPVRGRTVRDCAGRRLGRIVVVDYAATGKSEAWYLLRLTGWRWQLRAVPAASAGRGKRRTIQLAFARAAVLRSPQRSQQGRRHGFDRRPLQAFYARFCEPAGRA